MFSLMHSKHKHTQNDTRQVPQPNSGKHIENDDFFNNKKKNCLLHEEKKEYEKIVPIHIVVLYVNEYVRGTKKETLFIALYTYL